MKKIENTFVVTGFVGNNAEIRQFTNASVARFSLAVSRQEKNGEETNRVSAFMSMEAWRKNEHVDSFERLRRMAAEQDSLYEGTYKAFAAGQFATVKQNKQYAEANYPLSPLMPRFLFLNAVSVARTEGQAAFAEALRDMVSHYPESELGAMAKDMLAIDGIAHGVIAHF